MRVEFQNQGIRYSLQTRSQSLRERETAQANIQPDPKLWTGGWKKRPGLGLDDDVRPSGRKLTKIKSKGTDRVPPPAPEDFTDREAYR